MSVDYICPLCDSEIPQIRFVFPICDNCGADIRSNCITGAGRIEATASLLIGRYTVEGNTCRVVIRRISRILSDQVIAHVQISIRHFQHIQEPMLERLIRMNDWERFVRMSSML